MKKMKNLFGIFFVTLKKILLPKQRTVLAPISFGFFQRKKDVADVIIILCQTTMIKMMMKLALFALLANSAVAQTSISFFHINDHHSHIEELSFDIFDPNFIPADISVESSQIRMYYGGAPRTSALLTAQREAATSAGREVITLHGGDALTGTFFYTVFGNEMDAEVMNFMGFDAFVLGNHEFDEGDSNAAEFVSKLNMPTLSANLNPAETSAFRSLAEDKAVKPSTILSLSNGEQVGVCGITIKVTTEQSSFPDEGTTIAEERASAEACLADLVAQGLDKIVLLTHVGNSRDQDFFGDLADVDVVIGGHSHALLGGEEFSQLGFPTQGPYAELVNGKCIVTAWEYLRVLGELVVDFDADGVVTACSGSATININPDRYTVRDVDPRFDLEAADAAIMTDFLVNQLPNSPFTNAGEDAAMVTLLEPYFTGRDEAGQNVIGTAEENICHTYTEQDPLCPTNNVTNCLSGGVCNLVSQGFLFNVPSADVAIQNRGGCRTDILAGDVKLQDAFEILPFANTLVTFDMTGAQIKAILEDSVNFFLDPELGGGGGSYPFAAGLRFDIDYTQAFGSRINNIEINPRLEGEFAPLGDTDVYNVVTNSFVAGGRDGYFTFTDEEVAATFEDIGVEYGQSFVNYIESVQTLTDPAPSLYSTQSIVTSDGEVCDVAELIEPTPSPTPAEPDSTESATTGLVAFVVMLAVFVF